MAKLLYNYKCTSDSLINKIFSSVNLYRILHFCVQIPIIYDHLWVFCPSGCWSDYKRHKSIYLETSISRLLFMIKARYVFVKFLLINENLFYGYCICWSCSLAIKDINVYTYIYRIAVEKIILFLNVAIYMMDKLCC